MTPLEDNIIRVGFVKPLARKPKNYMDYLQLSTLSFEPPYLGDRLATTIERGIPKKGVNLKKM